LSNGYRHREGRISLMCQPSVHLDLVRSRFCFELIVTPVVDDPLNAEGDILFCSRERSAAVSPGPVASV